MRDCISPKLSGLFMRLRSRNSERGRRFDKRLVSEPERRLARRSPTLRRDVSTSMGMDIRAIFPFFSLCVCVCVCVCVFDGFTVLEEIRKQDDCD